MSTPQPRTNRRLIGFLWVLLLLGLAGLGAMALWRGAPRMVGQTPVAVQPTATVPGVAQGGSTPTRMAAVTQPVVGTQPAAVSPTRQVEVSPATAEVPTPLIVVPPTLAPAMTTPTDLSVVAPTPPVVLPEPTVGAGTPNTPEAAPTTGAGGQGSPQQPEQPQQPQQPQQSQPTATKPPQAPLPRGGKPPPTSTPTRKPAPAVHILPNGVRYGDRKPNLPGRIVRISSPNIKLDTQVYEVYAPKGKWEVADYAGGHHYNTPNPGEGGNIVVAGHNNWKGEVFRYLEFLVAGNEIWVWTLDGKQHKYRVEEVKKLKETGATNAQRLENGKVMDPTPYEQLTLITCWPYTTYTHRLIVVAKPMK